MMYAKGMSTSDIETHIQDIYDLSVSDSTASRVTDKILPVVREWPQRLLKRVYGAVDERTAMYALDGFEEKWQSKYLKIAQSWRQNWPNLSTYFKYPQEVRTLICTTNAIENFNRGLRKVTKSKSVFPTDDALLKMRYLAMMDITKKWTGRRKDWGIIHSQLEVYFEDRTAL